MPIHKRIISGFKKILPVIAPIAQFIPGGALVTGIAGTLLGGTRQVLEQVSGQLSGIAALPPSQFGPTQPFITPSITVDPVQRQADIQEDVDRIVAEIRRGSRSRSNVPPRLKSAVDAALGGFVFGALPAGVSPAPSGETATQRYRREVLAGARSIDNTPPGVSISSSMKRELAASVLKKFGSGAVTVPARLRPPTSVTAPTQVAAQRPFFGGPTVPTRQISFGQFPGVPPTGVPQNGAGFAPVGGVAQPLVPLQAGFGGLVGIFAAIMSRTGITNGVKAIALWIRGNPATAGALALSAGLTADQLLDDISEKAMIKSITGGVVLSRNDLKGFNRTVKVAKKLKVFARRAPRRARSVPGHRHTVRSHR